MSYEEKKDKIKAGIGTGVLLLLLLIFLHFCGLSYTYPPPPPKKVLLIEMTMESGGGGGGGNTNARNNNANSSADNIIRQHDVNLPSVPVSRSERTSQNPPTEEAPQPNVNAMYRPGVGNGSGGGSGTGVGSGIGSGLGPGTGSGSGTGIGWGMGNRGYTYMPNLTTSEEGKVYVRVHVGTDGTVKDAQVISSKDYPTSITNAKIQSECVAKAKTAKYKPGKEEFRVILFSL